MFVVIGEMAGSAGTVINYFETGVLQTLDEAGGAQSGRSFFAAWQKCGCARGRANQGNLLLLTGDFDRQERLLKFALTGPACGRQAGTRTNVPVADYKKLFWRFSGAEQARWLPVPAA